MSRKNEIIITLGPDLYENNDRFIRELYDISRVGRKFFDLNDLVDEIIDDVQFDLDYTDVEIEERLKGDIGINITDKSSKKNVYLRVAVKKYLEGEELENFVVQNLDKYL